VEEQLLLRLLKRVICTISSKGAVAIAMVVLAVASNSSSNRRRKAQQRVSSSELSTITLRTLGCRTGYRTCALPALPLLLAIITTLTATAIILHLAQYQSRERTLTATVIIFIRLVRDRSLLACHAISISSNISKGAEQQLIG
jgi:Kef-type K+ transport system membrane component KefB